MTKLTGQPTLLCRTCAAEFDFITLEPGAELRCGRCTSVVRKQPHSTSLQPAWALATTGLLLAILANVYPVLTFSVAGNTQSNLIITGVIGLDKQGYWPVGVLVFFCAIAAPILHFLCVWYVCAACCTRRNLPAVRRVAAAAERLEAWSLVPVFAIACLVAVVKLDMLGTVTWDSGIFWIVLLSFCSISISEAFNPTLVEEALEALA